MALSHSTRAIVPLFVICAASARSQGSGPGLETVPPSARAALAATDISWKTRRTPHALVHMAGSAADRRLAPEATRIEKAIADNLAFLGSRGGGPPLHVFLVGSRDQIRRFTGREKPQAWSIPEDGTVFLVGNDSVSPDLRRETMRLLAWRTWGAPAETWLLEGVAMLAAGPCRGQSVEQVAAAAKTAGMFVPLDTLRQAIVSERELGLAQRAEAATLVRFVDGRYGRKKLRLLWASGIGGVEKSLGIDAGTLEKNWRQALMQTAPQSSWASLWRRVDARGCE